MTLIVPRWATESFYYVYRFIASSSKSYEKEFRISFPRL